MTDYTENDLLSSFRPDSLKRKIGDFGLKVLHIGAWDERTLVNNMEFNAYYRIDDVRFAMKPPDGLKGSLNLSDNRIKKISKTNDTPAFIDFLK